MAYWFLKHRSWIVLAFALWCAIGTLSPWRVAAVCVIVVCMRAHGEFLSERAK